MPTEPKPQGSVRQYADMLLEKKPVKKPYPKASKSPWSKIKNKSMKGGM